MRSERGRGLHSSASSRMQRVWSGVELGSCAPATHMLCSSYHQDGKDGSPTAKFPPYFYSVLFALEIGKNRVPTSSWNLLPSKEEEEGKKVGDNLHSSNKMRDSSVYEDFISYPIWMDNGNRSGCTQNSHVFVAKCRVRLFFIACTLVHLIRETDRGCGKRK